MIPNNRFPSGNKPVQPVEEGTKHTKIGFWRKAVRVISNAPGAIYRGIKWMTSISEKSFNLNSPKKKIPERSVKVIPDHTKSESSKKQRKPSSPSSSNLIKRLFNFKEQKSKETKKMGQPVSNISNSHLQDKKSTPPNAGNITALTPKTHHQHVNSSLEDDTDDEFYDDNIGLVPLISDTDDFDEEDIDPIPLSFRKDDNLMTESVNTDDTAENKKTNSHTTPNLFSHKNYLMIGEWRAIQEKQLDDLAHQLTIRRQQVQEFIRDTQLAFLRYGPSSESTLHQLHEMEQNSLSFTRGLLYYNKKAKKHPKLSQITESLEDDFTGLKAFVTDAKKYDFRSGHQYLQQVQAYKEVTDNLLKMEKKPIRKNEKKQRVDAIINEKVDIGLMNDTPTTSDNPPHIPVECVAESMDMLLNLDADLRKEFSNNKMFDDEMIRVLAKNGKSFQSQLHVYLDGKWKKVSSRYTPAAAMRLDTSAQLNTGQNGNRAPFEKPYNGKFCPSMECDTKHALNMLGYTMEIDDKPVTSQLRVGCPYAFAEKTEKRRDEVTLDRIKEIFTALLVQNHSDQLQTALRNPGHSPIDLTATYLNLLSPDNIRHSSLMTALGLNDEKKWVKKLHRAFKELSGKEMKLKVYLPNGEQTDVKIIPNVRMFVIPCNQWALQQSPDSKLSKRALNEILRHFSKTWTTVNKVNAESLKWLLGPDGPVRQRLTLLTGAQKNRVNQLISQMLGLFNSSKVDFEKIAQEKNPFIFAEILSQLLEKLEIDIFSGCKSNKDRTSIFQSVMQSMLTTGKYLHESHSCQSDVATQPYNLVPELFMVYGGHTDIQKRNTGLVGYRLDETPGKDLDHIGYKFMRRRPLNGERQKKMIFTDPESFSPITPKEI